MTAPPPSVLLAMQRASALLQAGNFPLARAMLEQVLREAPRFVEAHRLLAGAMRALGDDAGAERTLRNALAIEPAWAPTLTSLAELLVHQGRGDEAEPLLRDAIASARPYPRATSVLAGLLNARGRAAQALAITAPLATAAQADPDLLEQHATALAGLERHDEAAAVYRRIAATAPERALAELNLAAALDAAGRHRDAEAHARSALGKNASNPQAHFVHARALIALNRFDEAQAALLRAIALQPTYVDAQQNLAQLIWMRSGSAAAACEHLDTALRAHPDAQALHVIKASVFDGAGDARAAHAWLAERAQRSDAGVDLLMTAAQAALKFDPPRARAYAQRAAASAPAHALARRLLADCLVATGAIGEAEPLLGELLQAMPDDQHLIALQTTLWRLRGDARYAQYCDYSQMTRSWTLATPHGWSTLGAYLRDLAESLHGLHRLHTHPLYQSLRNGSQTTLNLTRSDDPAIRAFFEAIDGPVRRHIETIGHDPAGLHPLRRRHRGSGYRLNGIWSVRLRGEGYHTNHVHPKGWLSSACYIELPRAVIGSAALEGGMSACAITDDRMHTGYPGWLKFGEPGIPTLPPLAPEHVIRPEPGLLALFPSYFWHGTVPFSGDGTRLTIAFDVVPAS